MRCGLHLQHKAYAVCVICAGTAAARTAACAPTREGDAAQTGSLVDVDPAEWQVVSDLCVLP